MSASLFAERALDRKLEASGVKEGESAEKALNRRYRRVAR
jgi:hypothetical protein